MGVFFEVESVALFEDTYTAGLFETSKNGHLELKKNHTSADITAAYQTSAR